MKRLYVMVGIILFMMTQGFGQVHISGKVTDEQNNPLPGAHVAILETDEGTITDANGYYSLTTSQNGEVTFQVSFVGYERMKEVHNLNQRQLTLNFQMHPATIWGDEIIVQATRAGAGTPVAFQNLSGEELEKGQQGQDIPYLLSLTPSVVETSESGIGTGYTSMRIRGTDPTRINVTINGIPLNDSESQGVFWVNMPDFSSSVESVQIQRGVGTSTNGSGAFGATINFKTEGISSEPYAEITSHAGSFNTFKNNLNVGSGLIKDHWSFDARISKVKTDGYIDYAFSDHESMYLSGAYRDENTLAKANIIYGDQRTGISWWGVPQEMLDVDRKYNPAGQYTDMFGENQYYEDQTDNYTQTHYQLYLMQQLTKNWNASIAVHYTRGEGYYEQYKESDSFADYGLPNIQVGDTLVTIGNRTIHTPDSVITEADMIRQKWLENDFYGFTYATNYEWEQALLTLGGAWNHYEGDHFGNVLWSEFTSLNQHGYQWYMNTGTKSDFNMFGKINFHLTPTINLFGDVQYRYINYDLDGIDDNLEPLVQKHTYNFWNPKAGIMYKPNKQLEAYALFAIANREPTRSDLKAAVRDNDAIPTHETLYDIEWGANWRSPGISAGVNFYAMLYDDQLVSTGEKSEVGYDIKTNVDNSYRLGVELMANWQPFEKLNLNGNLTLSRNKITDFIAYVDLYDANWAYQGQVTQEMGTTDISYSPEVVGSAKLTYTPIKDLAVSWISKYVGDQYYDNTSSEERKIDAYNVNNLNINYKLPVSFAKSVDFSFTVINILDATYENNAYGGYYLVENSNAAEQTTENTWAYYFPQAGIHFMSGLKIRF
ncbi:MAG: TonB-dependent receptor [Bacteroidota bacterium]